MSKKNDLIEKFLQNYYTLKVEPRYAVLIKGNWGVGKTFFIKRSIESLNLPEIKKALYVSLYGVTNFSQIEDEFFRQLHPFLGSKQVKVVYSVLKSAIQATLKIDIDGDKKEDLSINGKMPNLDIFGEISKNSDLVLFFDDVERCDIPVNQLFGYINQFVERDGFKVVLIANEDELVKKFPEGVNGDYKKIKEKLIGRTFEIESYVDEAINFFINEIEENVIHSFFKKNLDQIKILYSQSQYNNLRFLRQVLMDFSAIMKVLDPSILANDDFLLQFFTIYIIISIEIKSGNLLSKDISNIKYNPSDENGKRVFDFLDKYGPDQKNKVFFLEDFVSYSCWDELFSTGLVDDKRINLEIKENRFFCENQVESWKQLWYFSILNDDDFIEILQKVSDDFFSGKIFSIEINKHVSCILLALSDRKLFEKSDSEILEMARSNLTRISSDEKFLNEISKQRIHEYLMESGYDGLSYYCLDKSIYRSFESEEKLLLEKALNRSYSMKAEKLLLKMGSDFSCFYSSLVCYQGSSAQYFDIPIMKFFDAERFVNLVITLTPENIRQITYDFINYRYLSCKPLFLKDEASWLGEVAEKFGNLQKEHEGKLLGYRLSELSKKFFEAQTELNKLSSPS